MVLALKIPARYDAGALLDMWPDLVSYIVSYAFIAVVRLNHHHVFKHAGALTSLLAWSNFASLFGISLIPFTTAWIMAALFAFAALAVFLPALVRLGLLGAFLALHTQPDLALKRQ